MKHLISFCINTAVNELDYIKLLFKSLKDNLSTLEHEIIVFIDSDNQGIFEWLTKQQQIFPNLKILKNPLPVCYGYARNINEMFKFASNDSCIAFVANFAVGGTPLARVYRFMLSSSIPPRTNKSIALLVVTEATPDMATLPVSPNPLKFCLAFRNNGRLIAG